jgi:dihydropteroate synthase
MTTGASDETNREPAPIIRSAPAFSWRLAPGRDFAPGRPALMGVVNVTPDSFSDGGEALDPSAAAERAVALERDGADLIDVGGESTRPGAEAVDAAEQIRRVVPAIRAMRDAGLEAPITIDTTIAAVAEAALDAGASAINDVSGGAHDPALLPLAASRAVGLILMHRLTAPARDRYSTAYAKVPEYPAGVVEAVRRALAERVRAATAAGVDPRAILVDPGVGFGKSVEQNRELVRSAGRFADLSAGVLIGASRKSFLAAGRDTPPAERDPESVAAGILAWLAGADVIRAHNVLLHRRALDAAAEIAGNTP